MCIDFAHLSLKLSAKARRDLMRFLDSLRSLEMEEFLVCQQTGRIYLPTFFIDLYIILN
ncbi:hypothetical protein ANHYDRO_01241 [Anaerococcus hydrogenalis DSM 7454]|uniref:Uncharacterized protein n=1 Tax=Anaerococcus hydrogenalis DSM 7454 TaxID=561177 RepID=B6W9I6_9FIRM|nr:hypothetical protein ANHYDRO_01241 [Anaerococcus hydrogenalis DSM 7454]